MDLIIRVRTNLGQFRVSLCPTDLSLIEIQRKVERENNIKIITKLTLNTPSGEEITDNTLKLQNGDVLYCRCENNDDNSGIISYNVLKDSKIVIKNGEVAKEENKIIITKASSSPKLKKIKAIKATSTTEDIADDLLSAVQGDSDKKSKLFRKCFGGALIKQYEETKAVFRLNAGLNNLYEIKISNSHRIFGSLESFTMTISYDGDKKSSEYTDVVDLLPLPLLNECIKAGYESNIGDDDRGKEILKPINLSKISPRIFWSVVHLYKSKQPFVEAYRQIFPEMSDFSFLNDRKLLLTEKSLENRRQEGEKQQKKAQQKKLHDERKRKRNPNTEAKL